MKPAKQNRFASVWDALEASPSAAAHMRLRANLMVHLQEWLAAQEGTQQTKADALGISQPRLNDLLQGKIERFSLDTLVDLAQAQGAKVEFKIRAAQPTQRSRRPL
jgi:predicted XRE-type DNA-binding protein